MLFAVCSVHKVVYNVQRALDSKQFSVCSVQCLVSSRMQCQSPAKKIKPTIQLSGPKNIYMVIYCTIFKYVNPQPLIMDTKKGFFLGEKRKDIFGQ